MRIVKWRVNRTIFRNTVSACVSGILPARANRDQIACTSTINLLQLAAIFDVVSQAESWRSSSGMSLLWRVIVCTCMCNLLCSLIAYFVLVLAETGCCFGCVRCRFECWVDTCSENLLGPLPRSLWAISYQFRVLKRAKQKQFLCVSMAGNGSMDAFKSIDVI